MNCNERADNMSKRKLTDYSGTSLKWTLTGQKLLSTLEKCPPWRGLN